MGVSGRDKSRCGDTQLEQEGSSEEAQEVG